MRRAGSFAAALGAVFALAGCAEGPLLPVQVEPAPGSPIAVSWVRAHLAARDLSVVGQITRHASAPGNGYMRVVVLGPANSRLAVRCLSWSGMRKRYAASSFATRFRSIGRAERVVVGYDPECSE